MSLRIKVQGRQRIIATVSFDEERNACVFRYDPPPARWRFDGCGADNVLQRLDRATQRFAGQQMNDQTRRSITCEVQAVLDSLVDAGNVWVTHEEDGRN